MRKGFFSALTAALVIAAITASAIAIVHLSSQEAIGTAEFSAKLASDRQHAVKQFFGDTINDALLDAAYSVYGCNPTLPDFCQQINMTTSTDRISYYLNWSVLATNESLALTSYYLINPYVALPYICYPFPAEAGFNYSYNYSITVNLRVDTPNAFKQDETLFSRNVSIRNYTAKVINNTQTCAEAQLMRITIAGNYAAAKDYLIDCNQPTNNIGAAPCP